MRRTMLHAVGEQQAEDVVTKGYVSMGAYPHPALPGSHPGIGA